MSETSAWQTMFAELRRRKVFRTATLYVIVLWPLVQLADVLQPTFGYPDSVLSALLYMFVGGFPVALTLAWIYDFTRAGVVRTSAAGSAVLDSPPDSGRTAEAVAIGVLTLLVVALFLFKTTLEQPTTEPVAPAAARAAPSPTSLAVLPFITFSTEEQDQVFADGLTEELLNRLARITALRVAARTSSFAYKGVNRNVQDIGRELGVGHILEGSVRRSDVGATIRVTAQLVDVANGAHLWSQSYDREFHDVLRLQDEIAMAVAERLSVTLLGTASGTGTGSGAATTEALIAVSRGRAAIARRSAGSLLEGVAQLEKGVAASPDWAEAHASLAEARVLAVLYSGAPPQDMLPRAQEAVDAALRLDPLLGSAWAAQGLVLMQDHAQPQRAREALERAIELNPSYAMAYMWLGSLQENSLRRLELHRKAFELDPRSAVAAYNVAHDLLDGGQEEQAMQVFERIVAADPLYSGAYRITARLNERHGRIDEAVLDYRRLWDINRDGLSAAKIAELSVALGDNNAARRWIERAEASTEIYAGISALWVRALLALQAGNRAESEHWLEQVRQATSTQGDVGTLLAAFASSLAGKHAEAVTDYDRAPERVRLDGKITQGNLVDAYLMAVFSYREVGRPGDADRILVDVRQRLDTLMRDSERVDPQLLYHRARIHALDGDPRMALALLERAIDEGWTEIWRLRVDPLLVGLRPEPRFAELEARLRASLDTMRENLEREHALD